MRILFLALSLLVHSSSGAGDVLKGRVVGILDGDTLTLLDQDSNPQRIRLAQIDAPEKSQAFGQRSKQSLSDLAFNREAEVQVETRDRYGRLVGKILVGGMDINLAQIRQGMAWVYRHYAKEAAYFEAEAKARESRTGLWADSNPTPPWIYRHPKRSNDGVSLREGAHSGHPKGLSEIQATSHP